MLAASLYRSVILDNRWREKYYYFSKLLQGCCPQYHDIIKDFSANSSISVGSMTAWTVLLHILTKTNTISEVSNETKIPLLGCFNLDCQNRYKIFSFPHLYYSREKKSFISQQICQYCLKPLELESVPEFYFVKL